MGMSEDSASKDSLASNDHPQPISRASASSAKHLDRSIAEDDLKRSLIFQACRDRDIPALAKLAGTKGGLLDDKFRQDACLFPRSRFLVSYY